MYGWAHPGPRLANLNHVKLRARTKTRTKARGVSSESVKFKVHDNPLESEWFLYESLVCSWYKLEPLGECVYQQKKSEKWDIPWYYYITRERCITILYHAIEITVAKQSMRRACSAWREGLVIPSNIQQLFFVLVGCIFYGVVEMLLS